MTIDLRLRIASPPGAPVPLNNGDETIGAVLRSAAAVKPVFVSPGYRVDPTTSVQWLMHAVSCYKLPETTGEADALASARRKRMRPSNKLES